MLGCRLLDVNGLPKFDSRFNAGSDTTCHGCIGIRAVFDGQLGVPLEDCGLSPLAATEYASKTNK